jgi:hypothetical protein
MDLEGMDFERELVQVTFEHSVPVDNGVERTLFGARMLTPEQPCKDDIDVGNSQPPTSDEDTRTT